MRKPLISLGDALRVAVDLKPRNGETRTAIVKMLGLEFEPTTPAQRSIGAWKPSSAESVITAQRKPEISEPIRIERPALQPDRLPEHRAPLTITIKQTRKGSGVFDPPEGLNESSKTLDTESEPSSVAPTPPLFRRVVRRGILAATLSTLVPEGDLDTDRILRTICDGQPIERLPRLPRATMRRGVQVLLERSPSMDPFRQDQCDLVKALTDILTADRLEVLYFAASPFRGVGSGARSTWREWKPPPRGTPILAVTDLGIGGPMIEEDRPSPGEWLRFARRAEIAEHLLIALVPYEVVRWPPTLARAMPIIHWSERTTAGQIRRAIRDAERRLR
jgi:hypothetical protein